MIKQVSLEVAPFTSATSPTSDVVKLCPGILDTVVIRPPPGPNWEVYTRILHLENGIVPNDNTNWIPLEKDVLTFPCHFSEWKGVYKVTIELCSPQARFTHTIQYEFTVLEYETQEELLSNLIQKGF